MKDKIDLIFSNLKNECITEKQAHQQVLDLFAVVGQSEQLHKLLQYLSDEDDLIGNRTHQEIIDSFNQLG